MTSSDITMIIHAGLGNQLFMIFTGLSKAIDENKKNAEKFGNVVTQDIDAEGNLVGAGYNTTEQTFSIKDPDSISAADIRAELFESENVVVGKTDYGQSQLKSGPFANKNQ